jgi:hypothetical protein
MRKRYLITACNSLAMKQRVTASEHYAYILTVDEKYWTRLCQHGKNNISTLVFIRKGQVAPKKVERLLFYVTRKRQILGIANFLERLTGNYEDLWKKFGSESCFETFDEYSKFVDGRRMTTFIRFNNFKEIVDPKPKEDLVKVLGSLDRFGMVRYLDKEIVTQLV